MTGIVIDQSSPQSLIIPNTLQLTVTISPSDASNKTIIWSSSDTSRATVNTNGVVTARGTSNGTATITATTQDGGFTAQCTINVTFIPVTGVVIDQSSPQSLSIPNTLQLTATISPPNASNKIVIWSSSDTSRATVNT
ncbi:MAG: Ig domain-containing protein, partial [Spirochaetales bacterium]|nr:Ig domain-containing protein [Spirochaetales bacterium]